MLGHPEEPTVPQSENLSDGAISRETDLCLAFPYMIGAYLGDGWTTWCRHPVAGFWNTGISCMDAEIVERFRDELSQAFPKRGGGLYAINTFKTKSGTIMYTCSAKNRLAHDVLTDLTVSKTQIPSMIARADKDVALLFIAGLFDTDGGVSEIDNIARGINFGKRYVLKLGMTEPRIVLDAAAILQRFGVKVGPVQLDTKGGYRTMYGIQPNIRSFIESGFYLTCKRKAERLERWKLKVGASETLYAPPVTSGEDKVQSA